MDIGAAIKCVNDTIKDLPKIVVESIMENDAGIIDLNTSHLEEGKSSTGDFLSPPYAFDEYAEFKQTLNRKPPKGVPDLKFEGDFYSGFFIEPKQDTAWIDSRDEKTPRLERKYDNIFGIAPENRDEFIQIIAPDIIEKVKKRIIK